MSPPPPSPSPRLEKRLDSASGPFHFEGDTYLVYRGKADSVDLVTWMPSFPDPGPFAFHKDDIWFLRLPLPGTARIEYRLRVRQGIHVEELDDPLNPPSASNPFGHNSVITGSRYQAPWYAGVGHGGELSEIRVTSSVLGGRRHHHVYLPVGQSAGSVQALLLVHDGSDFLEHGGLGVALDLLCDKGVLPPIAAVLLDPWERISEYGASMAHSAHVAGEVIPHLERRLRLKARPEATVAMGSSLGGVAALALSYHFPNRVTKVASLSGSFAHRTDTYWTPTVFLPVIAFLEHLQPDVLADCTIYQSVGRYEGLVDFNRRLRPVLGAGGARLKSVETWTGHDWGAWQDRLEDALSFLLPAPAEKN